MIYGKTEPFVFRSLQEKKNTKTIKYFKKSAAVETCFSDYQDCEFCISLHILQGNWPGCPLTLSCCCLLNSKASEASRHCPFISIYWKKINSIIS